MCRINALWRQHCCALPVLWWGGVGAPAFLMWVMQAHHIDTDYYDRFFGPGAYGPAHAAGALAADWISDFSKRKGFSLWLMATATSRAMDIHALDAGI